MENPGKNEENTGKYHGMMEALELKENRHQTNPMIVDNTGKTMEEVEKKQTLINNEPTANGGFFFDHTNPMKDKTT